jgi:hypothetical protein
MQIRIKGCNYRYISPLTHVQEEIANAVFKVGTSCLIMSGKLTLTQREDRATILIPKSAERQQVPWTKITGKTSELDIDTSAINDYGAIFLPKSAKSITLNMTNSDYFYGLALWGEDSGFLYDSGWTANTPIVKDVSSYNEGLWMFSTFKKGEEGTDTIPQITIQDLGWSAEVQF